MEKVTTVLQVIAPVFAAVFLGMLARRKQVLTPEQNQGLQQYVVKYGLPCVLFNSCLTAQIQAESVTTMALVAVLMMVSAVTAFRLRKNQYPYHNLPQLFAAQETGMLGIPLYIALFGSAQAYRMGVLDLAQCPIAITTITLLTANSGENPRPGKILRDVCSSPFLIMSLLGLVLNLSGAYAWLNTVGIGAVISETTGFLAQPVSAAMLFSVGYNFALEEGNRAAIFRLSLRHFVQFVAYGALMLLVLNLFGSVDRETTWAVVLFAVLPASYLAPSLGRSQEDFTVASGVCSILTLVCLVAFCVIAAVVA